MVTDFVVCFLYLVCFVFAVVVVVVLLLLPCRGEKILKMQWEKLRN